MAIHLSCKAQKHYLIIHIFVDNIRTRVLINFVMVTASYIYYFYFIIYFQAFLLLNDHRLDKIKVFSYKTGKLVTTCIQFHANFTLLTMLTNEDHRRKT